MELDKRYNEGFLTAVLIIGLLIWYRSERKAAENCWSDGQKFGTFEMGFEEMKRTTS